MTRDIVGEILAQQKNELKHHGVKGMKWGVRRDLAAKGNKRAIKQLAKADKKWEREINSTKGFVKVNNAIADKMNGQNGIIAKLNNDPRWVDKDLTLPSNSKIQTLYNETFEGRFRKCFEEVTTDLYGESPSGNYTVAFDWDAGRVNVVPKDTIKHADDTVFKFSLDKNGKVTSFNTSTLRHDYLVESGKNALSHHGIKGMKWGVRRPVGKDGLVKSRGSRGSQDYREARKLTPKKQSALSNAELRRINERLQLERTNRELQSRGALQKIKRGTGAANTVLAIGATISAVYTFMNSPAGKAIRTSVTAFLDKAKAVA